MYTWQVIITIICRGHLTTEEFVQSLVKGCKGGIELNSPNLPQ